MHVPCPLKARTERRDGANLLRVLFSAVVCLLFVRVMVAQQTVSARTQVSRLLTAYEGNDFKTIFGLSYAYQSHLDGIRQSNPQVMWQQLTNDYFQQAEKDYIAHGRVPASTFSVTGGLLAGLQQMAVSASSSDNPADCPLRSLLDAQPKWKILEMRNTHWQDDSTGATVSGMLVYIELNFGAPDSSPLFGEGLLKKLIVGVTLEGPKNLFFSARAVPKSEALWANPPLRLLSVQWNTVIGAQLFAHDTVLGYNVLGGVPPYRSRTTCDSLAVESLAKTLVPSSNASIYGSPLETPTDTLRIEFGEPRQERFPLPCTVRITDSRGQQDVAHFVVPQLESQLWSPFCWIRNPWYGWKQGLPNARQGCEKLYELQAGAISGELEHQESELAVTKQTSPPRAPRITGTTPAPRQLPACGNYQSCYNAGLGAYRAANWPTATDDFQAAADQAPTAGGPWFWLGQLYFHNGQNAEASRAWDKALSLGTTIGIGVCHELAFRPCQSGSLYLSSTSITFVINNNKSVFSVPPSDATFKGVFNNSLMGHASFGLEVAHRRYNFDPFPLGVSCRAQLFVNCPQSGVAQQLAVADYVSTVLAKLTSGALGAAPANTQLPPERGRSVLSNSPSPTCQTATSLGYSIQSDGHTYSVKGIGAANQNQVHVFVDESGAVVRNAGLLQQLVLGAWTKERIVDRYNPSSGSGQVRTFLAVSSNLEGWEDATDALARATVESIKAVVTGGTSLSTTAENLTLGVVKNQLMNPKVELAHWARAGLEQSLADYTAMEGLLPATGTTTFKLSVLEKIASLYADANALASVNEALAAAIAPTTWQDELGSYLSSAVDQLKPSVPASTTLLTLSDVLKLEEIVAATGKSFNAYRQSLDLAQKLAQSNRQSISHWVAATTTACGTPVASAAPMPEKSGVASIRNVDFRNFSYPSGCSHSYPRLGFPAVIPVISGEWKQGKLGQNYVSYSVGQPIYGRLLGNDEEQAVVPADCFLGNGDDEEIFVYRMSGAMATLIQRLTPSDWDVPKWGIDWATKKIRVEGEDIRVTYLAGGYRARPTWAVEVALRWNGSQFVASPISREPFTP